MSETILLSRPRIETFLICPRRFYHHYVNKLAWPDPPLDEATETAVLRGQQLHQLIERRFHDLPTPTDDAVLSRWLADFDRFFQQLPAGKRLPELSLTIPLPAPLSAERSYLLNGRFDLAIVNAETAHLHLFDWKTGRPQSVSDLRHEWQTRIYLALMVEGAAALGVPTLQPERVTLTYWYGREPNEPRVLTYSTAAHRQNWDALQEIAIQIEHCFVTDSWPKVADWSPCQQCTYQLVCGRQTGQTAVSPESLDEDSWRSDDEAASLFLDPETP